MKIDVVKIRRYLNASALRVTVLNYKDGEVLDIEAIFLSEDKGEDASFNYEVELSELNKFKMLRNDLEFDLSQVILFEAKKKGIVIKNLSKEFTLKLEKEKKKCK